MRGLKSRRRFRANFATQSYLDLAFLYFEKFYLQCRGCFICSWTLKMRRARKC